VDHKGGHRISVSWTPAVPIPLDVIEIDKHATHNHSLTSETIQHSLGSGIEDNDKQHDLV
jgi:hypothetical protein